MARGWGWGSWGRTRGSARPAWPGTTRWPHPAVEQRVEDVVGRGLGPPLQDLREEQELERNTDVRPRPPALGPSPRLNQSSLPGCFFGGHPCRRRRVPCRSQPTEFAPRSLAETGVWTRPLARFPESAHDGRMAPPTTEQPTQNTPFWGFQKMPWDV